jgi:minor extracellular serine protease Vpr
VTWQTDSGNAVITDSDPGTDQYGVAAAIATFGSQTGTQIVEGDADGLGWQFSLLAQNAPAISGVGNAATFGPTIAAGSYLAIVGSNLATTTAPYLRTGYLPLSLAATSVSFTTSTLVVAAPLSYVSPAQVNVQVPWELAGQASAVMHVNSNYISSADQTVNLTTYAPGIFEYPDPKTGKPIAATLDLNFARVTSANPIPPGSVLQIYANGLGPVSQQQISGQSASSTSVVNTSATATVKIGGEPATVIFSGLSPGSVSLYQLNVTVPANAPAGYQPVVVTIGGVSSQTSHVYVQ